MAARTACVQWRNRRCLWLRAGEEGTAPVRSALSAATQQSAHQRNSTRSGDSVKCRPRYHARKPSEPLCNHCKLRWSGSVRRVDAPIGGPAFYPNCRLTTSSAAMSRGSGVHSATASAASISSWIAARFGARCLRMMAGSSSGSGSGCLFPVSAP